MISNVKVNSESSIKMLDLYFSELSFKNNRRTTEPTNLKCNNSVDYDYDLEDKTKVMVKLKTILESTNDTINILVETIGEFSIPLNLPEEERESIAKNNTLAIMFPFVRSEITLLTSQPGLMPVVLPPLNITKLAQNK